MNSLHRLYIKSMISCEKATMLASRGQHQRLSVSEWVALRYHLSMCHACRMFRKQIKILLHAHKHLEQKVDSGQKIFELPADFKAKLENTLKNQKG